jgi:hypothetical protein
LKTTRPLIAVLLLSSACVPALPRFQAGKPVDVTPAPIGNHYKQNGSAVDLSSLIDGLEALEPTRAEAASAGRWMGGARVVATVGGAAIGGGVVYGLGGEKTGWIVAGAGVADGHLSTATGIYNKGLAPRASTTSAPTPWLAPAVNADGKTCGAQGGISLAF